MAVHNSQAGREIESVRPTLSLKPGREREREREIESVCGKGSSPLPITLPKERKSVCAKLQ